MVYLSGCSTDLRSILGHSVYYQLPIDGIGILLIYRVSRFSIVTAGLPSILNQLEQLDQLRIQTLIVGGGQIEPCNARISEKCLFDFDSVMRNT